MSALTHFHRQKRRAVTPSRRTEAACAISRQAEALERHKHLAHPLLAIKSGGSRAPAQRRPGICSQRMVLEMRKCFDLKDKFHSSKRYGCRLPDGQGLESKAKPPPFQSSVVGMVSDLRDQTIKGSRTSSKVLCTSR